MKSAKSKRQLTLLTLVVALGVAVYLNWEYAKGDTPQILEETAAVSAQVQTDAEQDETTQPVLEALPDKNYGEAQLVSADEESNDKYFEQARLTRTKTRDEALDTLQKSLKDSSLSEEEKQNLTTTLSSTLESITIESDIENMVKAKGFADCVAFIEGDKINLAVKTGAEGLDKTEVAQLRDIILSKMETEAKNISIVEVK
ncbi:SpoIIIAH-like family protein [uncultured Ruthenibacterium sp.]|uniref:SpoIIIAH-like family protein n=1 Tax=uncultured Ruthenibacterium sp. TaxID=1905347 RepID=UPI00349EE557